MKRIIVGSSLFVFASYAAIAQTTAPPLSFEVASLKPSAPSSMDMVMRRMSGGPGSTDPGTLTYTNITLKILVTQAYSLKDYQVEGPDWIDGPGYDLVAKMPPGTTKEQMAQMLQTLLAERFKLVVHRETKQLPTFALVVAKGGSKMKEVEVPAVPAGPPPGNGAGRGGPLPGYDSGALSGARGGAMPRISSGPGIRMSMTPNGRQLAGYMTMTQLANQLTRLMERPVLDKTELTATYDVDITWMPDDMERGPARMAAAAGGGGGEAPHGAAEPVLTLPQALQEKLGLKLDPRKSSAEVLIIDRADKVPVEN